jgi:hypothetical protein
MYILLINKFRKQFVSNIFALNKKGPELGSDPRLGSCLGLCLSTC